LDEPFGEPRVRPTTKKKVKKEMKQPALLKKTLNRIFQVAGWENHRESPEEVRGHFTVREK